MLIAHSPSFPPSEVMGVNLSAKVGFLLHIGDSSAAGSIGKHHYLLPCSHCDPLIGNCQSHRSGEVQSMLLNRFRACGADKDNLTRLVGAEH